MARPIIRTDDLVVAGIRKGRDPIQRTCQSTSIEGRVGDEVMQLRIFRVDGKPKLRILVSASLEASVLADDVRELDIETLAKAPLLACDSAANRLMRFALASLIRQLENCESLSCDELVARFELAGLSGPEELGTPGADRTAPIRETLEILKSHSLLAITAAPMPESAETSVSKSETVVPTETPQKADRCDRCGRLLNVRDLDNLACSGCGLSLIPPE